MKVRRLLGAAAILSLSASPSLAIAPTQTLGQTNQLYAADYGTNNLKVYDATLTQSGGQYYETLTQSTPVQTITAPVGSIAEGISGTNNDLITVVNTGSGWELARFTKSGTFIGYVGAGQTTFSAIGSFALSSNGQDAYIADPTDGGGEVVEISLSTGKAVTTVDLAGAHDVGVLNNGDVIAEELNGSTGTSGIEEYTSSLSGATTFVPIGSQGELEPGTEGGTTSTLQGNNQYGFTIDASGNVWTVSDDRDSSGGAVGKVNDESGTVYEFSSTGAFVNSWTLTDISSTLAVSHDFVNSTGNIGEIYHAANNPYAVGTFGLTIGGDGNLYLSDLGGQVLSDNPSNTTTPTDGGDNIAEFNTSTDLFSIYIQGDAVGTDDSATGLSAPKYANWATDFITANDAGVPEPSGIVTLIVAAGLIGGLAFRSRRRASLAMDIEPA